MTDKELMLMAEKARERAYSPYSGFSVGAALLTEEGNVYTGCNIENAALGSTVCAECTAFFSAIAAGERKFSAIAITGGRVGQSSVLTAPCGVCRQVMREFCTPDFRILLGNGEELRSFSLGELLPLAFGPDNLFGSGSAPKK